MRMYIGIMLGVLFCSVVAAAPASAQTLPWGIGVDTSLRVEYLFGSQVINEADRDAQPYDRFKLIFDPRMPLLSGTTEITPSRWISGRLAGSTTIFDTTAGLSRSTPKGSREDAPSYASWRLVGKPHYSSWEAGGLLHLWNEGGYRFSVTSGFRRRIWQYSGRSEGESGLGSASDYFTSNIPFIGLQTSMYFPFWKARFEMLGSPFMNKDIDSSYVYGGHSAEYSARPDRGGFLEFRMDGTVFLTSNFRCGLAGKLTYEELRGTFNWKVDNAQREPIEAYVNEVTGIVGLDLTVLF